MKIEITGKMDEKLTEDEYLELIDLLGFKFGIDNIKITEEEI